MQLEEFFDYKNQLIKDLLTEEKIVKLIDPNNTYSSPKDMVYDNVNPFEYYPETIEHGKVYVCCDVDVRSTGEKPYYSLVLYIWVFAHKSLLRLQEGGVRTDAICCEINKKINGSRKYGLGKLGLYKTERFVPLADFTGKMLTYCSTDFLRIHDPGDISSLPSNRKNRS